MAPQTPPERKAGHLAEVLRWHPAPGLDWVTIVAAVIGMAGPVLAGGLAGALHLGLIACLGSLMLGGTWAGDSVLSQLRDLFRAFVPVAAAVILAVATAGHGWVSDAVVIVIVGAAALVGGASRTLAVATTRFNLLLLIAAAVGELVPEQFDFAVLTLAGAIWTMLVTLVLGVIARALPGNDTAHEVAPPSGESAADLFTRWRQTLSHVSGWQYALRLTLCLAIAAVLKALWPEHHLHWITLTVGLLTDRQANLLPVKTTQRTLGTAIGVLVAALLFSHALPVWIIVVTIAVFAGARQVLRVRNYLAYSIVMTPLVIVIMDAGGDTEPGVLLDRLVATLIGAVLVVLAGLAFRRAQTPPML
jgi:hypothetical protein